MWDYIAKSYHRYILENHLRTQAPTMVGATLDIGSGSRRYDHLFRGQVTAIDVVPDQKKNITYGNLEENLQYPDNFFDSVVCLEVLDYIERYQHAITEIHRVLKPGGTAIISVAFMYHECGDKLRFTAPYLTSLLTNIFQSVEEAKIGNGPIIIWDILRKMVIFGRGPKFWRGFLLIFILPYLLGLRLFRAEQWRDRYYSGLFYVVKKEG